jgi:hypothetical protein
MKHIITLLSQIKTNTAICFQFRYSFFSNVLSFAIFTAFLLINTNKTFAQTNNVGIGTVTPDNTSILDLVSTSRGFLVPRMTTAQRTAIASPASSLIIYNTTTNTLQYNSGTPAAPVWLDVVAGAGVLGTGLAGQVPYWTAANTIGGSNNLFWNNGTIRLGIGNAAPAHTLDVSGNIGLTASSYINFGATDGTTGYGLRDNAGNIQYKNSGGAWAALGNTLDASYNQGGAGAGRTITANSGAVLLNGSNAADWTLSANSNAAGGVVFIQNTGSGLSFRVDDVAADATPFVIDDAGRVGIGTSAPSSTVSLDVAGNTRITGNLEVTGVIDPQALVLLPQGGAPVSQKGKMYFDGGTNNLKVYDGSAWQSVQTGTSSLSGSGTTGYLTYWNGASTLTGSSNLFWNTTQNRLGIATPTPSHTLDVNGNIGLATSSYINFDANDGVTGYGFRDNAGTIEYKNSGGAWAAFSAGGGNTLDAAYDQGGAGAGRTITVSDGSVSLVGSNAADWTLRASSNAAGGVFYIDNTGSGLSMKVSDNSGSMPFVIDQNGYVGVGILAPTTNLSIYENNTHEAPALNIEQAGSGDAAVKFQLPGQNAVLGIDQSDNNNIKISNTTSLTGTNDYTDANSMVSIHTEAGSEGIVDLNHQSRVRAYLNTDQTIPDGTWTKISFDAETYDEKSEFSGGTFTAKETGYYQVNARTNFAVDVSSVDNSYVSIAIWVDGSGYSIGNQLSVMDVGGNANIYSNAPIVSDVVYLAAGQTIEIYCYQNTGMARLTNSGPRIVYVSIHKLS